MRVALLEDDPSQAELLGHWLASAGHMCTRHERGGTLVRALRQESFDVLVLDWTLPDISGVDLLKQVRSALQSPVPILLISARASEADIVAALNQGADDYMVKPVRRLELLARLEAITRRGTSEPRQPQVLELGALRLDCQTRTAWRDDRPVPMTAKDFDLAVLFLTNVGRLLSRGELLEAVWGRAAVVSSRTLDTHICRIRDKLGLTPSNGWRLLAVYGHGYRLQEAGPSAPRDDGQGAPMSGSL
jgi:two-component system, OmpR family, response regulator RegX3